jgi:hypothetical protein
MLPRGQWCVRLTQPMLAVMAPVPLAQTYPATRFTTSRAESHHLLYRTRVSSTLESRHFIPAGQSSSHGVERPLSRLYLPAVQLVRRPASQNVPGAHIATPNRSVSLTFSGVEYQPIDTDDDTDEPSGQYLINVTKHSATSQPAFRSSTRRHHRTTTRHPPIRAATGRPAQLRRAAAAHVAPRTHSGACRGGEAAGRRHAVHPGATRLPHAAAVAVHRDASVVHRRRTHCLRRAGARVHAAHGVVADGDDSRRHRRGRAEHRGIATHLPRHNHASQQTRHDHDQTEREGEPAQRGTTSERRNVQRDRR